MKNAESSNLKWLDQSTFELTIAIPAKKITKERQISLEKLTKQVKIKGFRKGKAPLKMAEEAIEKNKIYEDIIQRLLPALYLEQIKKHQLKPITNPKFSLVSAEEGKDWQVKAVAYQKPKVSLGKYKEKIKKINAKEKIWVPGKEEKKETDQKKQENKEKRMQKIIQTLIAEVKVELPSGLVEDEVSRKLSQLIDQLSKASISLENHAASLGKNIPQIREEYRQQTINTLKIEFILEAVADKEKITVDKEELEKLAKTNQQAGQQINQYMVAHFLRQQKTIEYLESL